MLSALRNPEAASALHGASQSSVLGRVQREDPSLVGNLIWPYQCAAWAPAEQIRRIAEHFEAVERIPGLSLAPDDKLQLLDLSEYSPDTFVILDRAKWLSREGHLSLNLFKRNFRAFSVSFSLRDGPERELFIGGIQGRQVDNILGLYRDWTKDFHRLRPRDLILELLRLFARAINVQRISAVADAHKIARHRYFGGKAAGINYDEIWLDRGGERTEPSHFVLPAEPQRRKLVDVSSKKRGMYRKRYAMLDEIAARFPDDLQSSPVRHFEAL